MRLLFPHVQRFIFVDVCSPCIPTLLDRYHLLRTLILMSSGGIVGGGGDPVVVGLIVLPF